MPLAFAIRKHGTSGAVMVLSLDGCVDSMSAPQMDGIIDLLLEHQDGPIVVDMSRVSYVSSSGWRAFVSRTKDVQERRIELKIAAMQPTVRDVFELIGLGQVLEAHASVEEAIASCRDGRWAGKA